MATTTTSKPVKKLGQFLEEQQEPFILEIYLSERGCLRKNFNSDRSFKSSVNSTSNTSKKGIPHFPKVFKAVHRRLASINGNLKTKKDGKFSVTEVAKNEQQGAESDRFSSASSTTVFNSCSESDAEEATTSLQKDEISLASQTSQSFRVCNQEQKEAAADRDRWRHIEERSRQISPVSVLEGMPSNRGSPLRNSRRQSGTIQEENSSKGCIVVTKKVSEDSILSASLWNLFLHSATEKPSSAAAAELQQLMEYKPTSEFLQSKRVLQQTKQLLFDCVRDVVETRGKEKRQQNPKENLDSELVGELICEKVETWRRQSGGKSNTAKLLESDYHDSAQEWTNFEPEIKDIAMEIGDAILEDIKDEIVTDMVYFS